MEQGEVEQKIIEQCLRERIPFPKKIQDAPELIIGLELFFLGFLELTGSRTVGMSLGTIPWNIVNAYCVANKLTEDQTEEMHHHIKELDAIYLKHYKGSK